MTMKKFLVVAAVVALGSLAQASELWWTLADTVGADTSKGVEWSAPKSFANAMGRNCGGTRIGEDVSLAVKQFFGEVHALIDGCPDAASCFCFEMYDQVGISQLKQLQEAEDIDSCDSESPDVTVYVGFANFVTQHAMPEPTSGVLVVLGLMFLGLKRKRM